MGDAGSKNGGFSNLGSYEVEIHVSSNDAIFIPNKLVVKSCVYNPSSTLESDIRQMWELQQPGRIGRVSEAVIADGQIVIKGHYMRLACESLKSFAYSHAMSLLCPEARGNREARGALP